jgi:hypothetical protein
VPSSPCNLSRKPTPTWCPTVLSSPMSPRSSAHTTGFHLKLASSSRPWCLPTEQQGELPLLTFWLCQPYIPTLALRSANSGLLALPPLREASSHSAQSKLFSVLAPQWWNQLPPKVRTVESLPIFRKRLKPYLFEEYLKSGLSNHVPGELPSCRFSLQPQL